MKKLILLLIVLFSFLSCSIDDIETATTTTEDNNTINNNPINEASYSEVDPTKVKPPTGG